MRRIAYLDASAIVKLVVTEAESLAFLRWFTEAEYAATSVIGVLETIRATARHQHDPAHRAVVLGQLETLDLTREVVDRASALEPPGLRTLDAIHLATALVLLPELDAFVTYDDRLADAARAMGLPVVRPA